MATYTKSTNSYSGRYYKITLTQGSHNEDTGIVNVDWKFEVLGGSSNYYSAPATYVNAYNPVDGTTTTIYSHSKTMYPGTTSFPVAKGSRTGTKQFQTDSDGNLTLQITFHKDSMSYTSSSSWSTFNSVENWTLDQIPRQSARIRISGAWKRATPYVRVNGTWKRATAYIRVNNQWKRGG